MKVAAPVITQLFHNVPLHHPHCIDFNDAIT